MFGIGRNLCGSPSPTPVPKQGHPEQAAEDLVQAGLEYLQRRRLHNLSGQPVPVNSKQEQPVFQEKNLPECLCSKEDAHSKDLLKF